MDARQRHAPVLLGEVLTALAVGQGRPDRLIVDCTLGMGGHSEAILEREAGARIIGLDRDPESLALASERLTRFGERFIPVHADYRVLPRVLSLHAPAVRPSAILADLGVSSHQLNEAGRGFSFSQGGPLDMRMDRSQPRTAADLVATLDEKALADLIFEYGEEPRSRRIARSICREREREPIETTERLADIVARASGIPRHKQRIHPATRTFQALRIAVNAELEGLDQFLADAVNALDAPGGRLAVIAFHSLEDRIVKHTFKALSGHCTCPPGLPACACNPRRLVEVVTRRPITPGEAEIEKNPRSRSAKLRVAERVGE